MTPLRDDLMITLGRRPGTASDLADRVRTTPSIARKALDALCKTGRVQRDGFELINGRWAYVFKVAA
jgi:predicted transcriptional regulator